MQSKTGLIEDAWKEYKRLEDLSQKLRDKADSEEVHSKRLAFDDTAHYLKDWAQQKLRSTVYDIYGPYHSLWILHSNNQAIAARVYDIHRQTVCSMGQEFDYRRVSLRRYDPDDTDPQGSINHQYGINLEEKAQALLQDA